MTALREQQRALQAAIASADEPAGAGLCPRPSGEPALLPVYRHAYTARLVAALADNYLVLKRAMGDEAFEALALAFVRACPSRHPSIRWFGELLPAFMTQRDDRAGHPALVDVARMDWALRGAFDAPDAPALDGADLACVPAHDWPAVHLTLHPSAQVLDLAWTIEPAWRALRAYEPESGEPEPDLPAPEAHEHALLVWRQALETRWRSLEPLEAALLRGVQARKSFSELCELAAEALGEDAAAIAAAGALQQWLGDGLLSGWSAGPTGRV